MFTKGFVMFDDLRSCYSDFFFSVRYRLRVWLAVVFMFLSGRAEVAQEKAWVRIHVFQAGKGRPVLHSHSNREYRFDVWLLRDGSIGFRLRGVGQPVQFSPAELIEFAQKRGKAPCGPLLPGWTLACVDVTA